ncbi:MAG: ribosomal protein S18-alanine N-acetyltransferase [Chloroflexi bacterium]|nr:ribosomal protein S18-alanine N-acetyltransferase [Chloroflexota bacterium]MDA1147695.1 ribosomal protein S18-alanine N-acetyltransferase [Chloroflexota bacterium]
MTGLAAGVIRPMTEADLDAVRAIELEAYGTDAWSRRTLEDELLNGFSSYVVFEAPDQRVIGFAGVWFMRDQVHVVTIAVDPPFQRSGIAARLLLKCFELAGEAEMPSLVLEVRESNLGAQALYTRFGFRHLGRLRKYYRDDGEDALVMETPPLSDETEQQLLTELVAHYR